MNRRAPDQRGTGTPAENPSWSRDQPMKPDPDYQDESKNEMYRWTSGIWTDTDALFSASNNIARSFHSQSNQAATEIQYLSRAQHNFISRWVDKVEACRHQQYQSRYTHYSRMVKPTAIGPAYHHHLPHRNGPHMYPIPGHAVAQASGYQTLVPGTAANQPERYHQANMAPKLEDHKDNNRMNKN